MDFKFFDNVKGPIEFDPSRTPTRKNTMRVVLVEPGKVARIVDIDATLRGMQQAVRGRIEAVYPFKEPVCLICNEEGKLNRMSLNRAIRRDGKIAEIISGPFFVCAYNEADFCSLTLEQQRKYQEMFQRPEYFFYFDNKVAVIPYDPQKETESR